MSEHHLLTDLRKSRHLSQLELGLMADISARHISCIETGKSQPSRQILQRLSDVLDLSLRDRNLLLTSAGYAARFPERDAEDPALEPVRRALAIMLDNHDPYPALVMNDHWTVLMANRSYQCLMQHLLPDRDLSQPVNVMIECFSDQGLRPHILNFEVVASLILRRLRQQMLAYPDERISALFEQIQKMNPPKDWHSAELTGGVDLPVVDIRLAVDGQVLSLFSTLSKFGTAVDVGVSELIIEHYFASDDATATWFGKT